MFHGIDSGAAINEQISPDAAYVTSRLVLGIKPSVRKVNRIHRHRTLFTRKPPRVKPKEGTVAKNQSEPQPQ